MARLLPPLSVLLLALFPAAAAPPPVGPVKALTLDPSEFTDLADLLHVVRRSGRVELAADAPKGRLEVEIYRAGKRQAVHSVGYDQSIRPGVSRAVRFAVQAADLDYLPLGAGPKGHVRLLLKVRVEDGGVEAATTVDVPKGVFDHGRGIGGGGFSAAAGTAADVPLFWLAPGASAIKAGDTPKAVVANHPDAQVAVFSLRLGDPK